MDASKNSLFVAEPEILTQIKLWKPQEYWMYFKVFIAQSWDKRSAQTENGVFRGAPDVYCSVYPRTCHPERSVSEVEGSSQFCVESTKIVASAYRFVGAKIPPRASLGRDDKIFKIRNCATS